MKNFPPYFSSKFKTSPGVKAVFDEINLTLKDKPLAQRVCCCISSGRDVEKIQPNFRRQFIDRRVKNGISVRMIAPRYALDQTWPSSAKELRTTKMFDGKKYPLSIELNLAGDKVMLLSFRKPIGGITIESKPIAQSLRSVFNLLWELLGHVEPNGDAPQQDRLKSDIRD